MTEQKVSLEQLLPLMNRCFAEGKTVSFSPGGNSMRPMLEDGTDTVELAALPETLRKGDVVLYRRRDGSFVLHRLVKITDGRYYFCGDAQFSLEQVPQEQMLALLCAFRRKGKAYKTDAPAYRAYVLFWTASRPLRLFILRAYAHIRRRK